jgi:histidine ammonia-lyase
MGMTSAIKLKQVVRNTRHVLAIELLTATRALDCLRPLSASPIIEQVRTALAQVSPPWIADRSLTADIESTSAWIATGGFQNLTIFQNPTMR